MTSPYVRPDLPALADLERLLEHLAAELAAWRRRCQKAESELQAQRGDGLPNDETVRMRSRSLDLEQENLDLRQRLDQARDLLADLQRRLAFLEVEPVSEEAS